MWQEKSGQRMQYIGKLKRSLTQGKRKGVLPWRWNWLEFRQSVIFMVGIYIIFWLQAMCWTGQFMMQLDWRQQTMTWTNYISQLNLPREFDTLIFIDESSSKILFIDRKIRQFVNKRVAICKK